MERVKHFRFTTRGKRRLYQTPDQTHIVACRPWLVAKFARLRPEIIVVLGATAAKALLGPAFRVTRSRGVLLPWPESAQRPQDFATAPAEAGRAHERRPVAAARLLATIHPSAVLRAGDRDAAFAGLVADLTVAAKALTALSGPPAGR